MASKGKVEKRCADRKEFHGGCFSVCMRCAEEKYIPRGQWCAKHGPTFGVCACVKTAKPRFTLVRSSAEAVAVIATHTHRITSQPQAELVAYLTEGAL